MKVVRRVLLSAGLGGTGLSLVLMAAPGAPQAMSYSPPPAHAAMTHNAPPSHVVAMSYSAKPKMSYS